MARATDTVKRRPVTALAIGAAVGAAAGAELLAAGLVGAAVVVLLGRRRAAGPRAPASA